jgi:hypothetical protein
MDSNVVYALVLLRCSGGDFGVVVFVDRVYLVIQRLGMNSLDCMVLMRTFKF